MKKLLEELNLVQKIYGTLGSLGSAVAICYLVFTLVFANGSYSISLTE
jgi:hypothetical protein